MALNFERFVAFRYLGSKRKEVFISIITIISILGVAVSVMVLNIVLAVMTGFEAELKKKLINPGAHFVVFRYGGQIGEWEKLRTDILKVPGVVDANPFTSTQALLSFEKGGHGLLVRGVPDLTKPREILAKELEKKESLEALFHPPPVLVDRGDGSAHEVDLPGLIIGRSLQMRFGIRVGDTVTLVSPTFQASPRGMLPRYRRFQIVGVWSSGVIEFERTLAYTSLSDAQRFFGFGDGVTGLEVIVQDPFHVQQMAAPLRSAIGGDESPYYLVDWTEQNKALWEAMQLEKRVYFIVLLLLILVASFSIVSSLVMVVMEKSRDIALLKTMGARDGALLRVFLIQGIAIGLLGTIFGTILGWAGGLALREYGFEIDPTVFSLETVPVHLEVSNFVWVAISAFVITSLAGLYPALRAARLRPAEALRFE